MSDEVGGRPVATMERRALEWLENTAFVTGPHLQRVPS